MLKTKRFNSIVSMICAFFILINATLPTFAQDFDSENVVGIEFLEEEVRLISGDDKMLTVNAVLADGSKTPIPSEQVLFVTSDYKVANVLSNGQLFAALGGETTITAGYGGFFDTMKVIVYEPGAVTDITFGTESLSVEMGDEYTLPLMGTYSDGETRLISDMAVYSSSNENVATVDENGNLNIAGEGATQILAAYDGNETEIDISVLLTFHSYCDIILTGGIQK